MTATNQHADRAAALLCTQRELDEMCRTGLELVQEAIDTGDRRIASEMASKVQTARGGLAAIFQHWVGASLAYLLERHGEEAMTGALDPEEWLALGMNTGATLRDAQLVRSVLLDPDQVGARIGELVGAGSAAAAKRYWDDVEQATLKLHDYRIDWAAAVLSHVYRTYGSEGLAGALEHAAAQPWWRDRMTMDLDPVTRVREWSFFLGVGNFGQVSVSEATECFVIHHQVCGSCARQELRNMHEPPFSLARVVDPEPTLNFGIPDYTVYRTHLAAWHFVMPIRQGLAPWPAIDCSGVPGRCWFTLYKDPSTTPTRYYQMAGFDRKPDQESSPS